MLALRSALFNTLFYVTFVVMMIGGLPCLLLPYPALLGLVRLWARLSLGLLEIVCGAKVEVRGRRNVPRGAAIVAVKHQSFLETFVLITVLEDFCFVLKTELTAVPMFGWYLRATQQIGIDRAKRAGALLRLQQAVLDRLDAGRQIIIFPEGTRHPVGAPAAYKPGVAALCADSQVPCTPVALNTGLFWPRSSFKRRSGTVVVEFLPPIAPGLGKRDFMRALQNAIEPATDALVAEALAGDPTLDEFVEKHDAAPILT